MNQLTELMERLGRLQRQFDDLEGRLRRGPLLLKSQETVARNCRDNLEKVRERHKQLRLDAKEKEKHNEEGEQSIARRKTQLAESKNNKEFQALKLQIAADEAANAVLADETLEAMEIAEKYNDTVVAAEAELKKSIELYNATKKSFLEEEPTIRADFARCSDELKAAEGELSKDFRECYERLVRSHGGGEALAVITNKNFCGGCNQTLPINSIAMVIQGKPITCNSCGRLLYAPDGYQFDKG